MASLIGGSLRETNKKTSHIGLDTLPLVRSHTSLVVSSPEHLTSPPYPHSHSGVPSLQVAGAADLAAGLDHRQCVSVQNRKSSVLSLSLMEGLGRTPISVSQTARWLLAPPAFAQQILAQGHALITFSTAFPTHLD